MWVYSQASDVVVYQWEKNMKKWTQRFWEWALVWLHGQVGLICLKEVPYQLVHVKQKKNFPQKCVNLAGVVLRIICRNDEEETL